MGKRLQRRLLFVMVTMILCLVTAFAGAAHAQAASGSPMGVVVGAPVTPQISPALRDLPKGQAVQAGAVTPIQINPRLNTGLGPSPSSPLHVDPALQARPGSPSAVSPAPILSFDGVTGNDPGAGFVPPDSSSDVGPNHFVQMVNSVMAVYDKQGNRLAGPTPINELWRGQNNPCGQLNDGDPVVLYDQMADRWLVSQFAVNSGPPYYECIGISQTPDPTGAYFLYAFNVGKAFPDYPKLGVWSDAYYMSTNSTPFGAFAFDRQQMLQGQPGTFQQFGQNENVMLPADLDGATPPPAGSPDYFYTTDNNNQYKLWAFKVDFANPANSSFTALPDLAAAPYNYVTGTRIPQKGTPQLLDSIAEWPMWRFVYRNFGTHESLLGSFSVDVDGNGHIGIRWFELRKTGGGDWQIYQQGTYAPDANYRWMGSIAMDGNGDIGLGYSTSGPNLFPSIRYALRAAGDPLGTLRDEQSLVAGGVAQIGGNDPNANDYNNRWGDYSSMVVDPADDATFWYTTEYYATGDTTWRTRIGSFRLAAVGTPALAITKTVDTPNTPVQRGDAITYTITVANKGKADATDVHVVDTLPQYVDGANLDNMVTITAGQAVAFQIPAVLSDTAPYDTVIANTASFSHTTGGGQSTATFRVEPAPVGARPNLVSSFILTPTTPRANQPVTITVHVTNTGTSQADSFFVDFYINPVQQPITATYWADLAGDQINQGLEWEVATLGAGQAITLTSNGVGGQAPDPGFTLWDGYLPAGASDLYSYADSFGYDDPNGMVLESNEQDNSSYLMLTPLTPTLELMLDAPDAVLVNDDIRYTLTVTNSSDLNLTGVVVTDRVPVGSVFVAADQGGAQANGVVKWTIGQLDPNQTVVRHMTVTANQYYALPAASVQTQAVRPSVVGGITATVGAWPWQAAIVDASAASDLNGQYCGGTLIDADWVLTNASCVDGYLPSQLVVVLGRQLLSANTGQRLGVAQILINPDYNVIQKGESQGAVYIDQNDIALLRLAKPATINAQVAPIALLTPANAPLANAGINATVTGWGNLSGADDGNSFPDALHQVSLPIVSNQVCQTAYGSKFTVTAGMLCAGVPLGGVDACPGDDGGPLVVPDGKGGWLQAGIVSFKYGRGCGKANQYGVYTRVSQYASWINTAVNTISNESYQVTTDEGFRATGQLILDTTVTKKAQPVQNELYLPAITR